MRIKIVASFVIILTIIFMFLRPTRGAQFIIASWEFPDELGQGIYGITPYENSTGSFLTIPNPETGIAFCYYNNATEYALNYTADTVLRFDVRVILNYTNLDLTHPSDNVTGRNYIRVSVEMFETGESVFYQQNMTYDNLWGLVETGIWYYAYVDVVDVILQAGLIYVVEFTYEVFYVEEQI